MRSITRWLAAVGVAAALAAAPAAAEEAAAPAAGASVDEIEALVATLEDEAERARLVAQLEALIAARREAAGVPAAAAPDETPSLLFELSQRIDAVGGELAEAAGVLLDVPAAVAWVFAHATDPGVYLTWIEVAAKVVVVLLAGLVAEWVVGRLLVRPRAAVEDRDSDSVIVRVPFLAARTVLDLLPLGAFALAAYGVLPLTEPRPVTRLIVLTAVNANVLVRAIAALSRMVLAPKAANLRILPLGDETANYLYIWVRRFARIGVYGFLIAEAARLLGLPDAAYALIAKTLGLVLVAMAVVFILQNRTVVAGWLAGAPAAGAAGVLQSLRARLADIWHVVAILYLFAGYLVWALAIEGGFEFLARATALTAIVVVLAWLAVAGLRRTVDRAFRLGEEVRARFPLLEARANRYLPVLHRVLRIAVYVVAALAVLEVWGADVIAVLTSEAGRTVIGRLVAIALIVAGALVLWEVANTLIERALDRAANNGGRATRLRTLLPLMRNALRVVLAVLVTLIVLSEIGLDIGPLLAGAGVVGLAVGFGAQTLVKDVITGVFLLLEDAISVGDWVTVGGQSGTVEAMSIRTVRLRDIDGSVHTVPFSEITATLNYARDYGYAMLYIGVAYREDYDDVVAVIERVGAELQADETMRDYILEPLEVQGLNSFDDSAVVIRARIKTVAMYQWMVRRHFNRRLKKAFDEAGIEIPFPHRTIYFGEDKEGRAPAAPIVVEDRRRDAPLPPAGEPGSGER